MNILLGLFANKATWVVVVAVLVATILGVQHARITHLKGKVEARDAEIAILKTELAQSQGLAKRWSAAYAEVEKTIGDQNAMIDMYEREARLRFEHSQLAMRLAIKERSNADKVAQAITRLELANDECKALAQLVDAARAGGLR